MKLMKQNLGAHWVIGLEGKKRDIRQYHNRIYNWGGTNGELQWMSNKFAYFWITLEKLERVMFKYIMSSMSDKLGKKMKGSKGGLKKAVMNRVHNTINNIPNDTFVRTAQIQEFFSLGKISAEKLDHDS